MDNALSTTRVNLNAIHETLSSFSDIENRIKMLENRFYGVSPECEKDKDPNSLINITLSELMDEFSNYVPLYYQNVNRFKLRFDSEFLGIHVAETASSEDKQKELSRLEKCFAALDYIGLAEKITHFLVLEIRGDDVPDDNKKFELPKNIFTFLCNCNEILLAHKKRMIDMLNDLSEALLLEAS